jgi:PAS domain S-box-containing protein
VKLAGRRIETRKTVVGLPVDQNSGSPADATSIRNARYQGLFNAIPSAVFVCDRDGIILDYNHRARELWGREPTRGDPAVRYCGSWRLYYPDGRPLPREESPTIEVLRTGNPVSNIKALLERPDGSRITIRISMAALRSAGGEIDGVIVSFDDISEFERVQVELQESEDRYRHLVETSPYGIGVHRDGKLLYCNAHGLRILRASSVEELQDRSMMQFVHPADLEKVRQRLQAIMAGEDHLPPIIIRLVVADGSEVLVEATGRPVLFQGQRAVQTVMKEVTEIQRALAALAASEERFRTLAEQAADGVFLADSSGRYLDVNTAGCEMLGYSRQEICELSVADIIAPSQAGQVEPEIERLRGGNWVRSDWRFRRKDGSYFDGEVRAKQLPDSRLLGCVRDITDRRLAEIKLQEKERHLEASQRIAQVGSWELNLLQRKSPHAAALQWTDEAHRIFGYVPGQIAVLSDAFWNRVHPDDWQKVDEAMQSAIDGRTVYETEHRIVLPDGSERIVHERAEPVFDPRTGELMKFIGTVQDITARVQAEEALRDSDARLRTMLENLEYIAVQGYEPDGTITFWNKGSERFYRYSAEQALGQDIFALLHSENTRDIERQIIHQAFLTGEVPPAQEFDVIRQDGSTISIFANRILHQRPGKPPEFFCFDVDTSDRKRAEKELASRQAELLHAARLSTVGEMVAALSHEVSQPLSSIGNFAAASARLLESAAAADLGTLRHYVAEIVQQNQRCGAILHRLRDFSRRRAPCRCENDLNQLLRDSAALVSNELRAQGVSIEFELADELLHLACDRVQIGQVIVNLLTNARDALRDLPSERRTIVIRSFRDGDGVAFEIADQGIGLAEEARERLFEPFFTTKEQGMGVGLSICKSIVVDHRGQIEAQPNARQGATFRVWMPAAAPTPAIQTI